MHSLPAELDKIKREIIHKETEKASLSKENDLQSKTRLEEITKELEALKSKQKIELDI
jgi:ATP-dependent Clp protease ATP-binding subunit ClpA